MLYTYYYTIQGGGCSYTIQEGGGYVHTLNMQEGGVVFIHYTGGGWGNYTRQGGVYCTVCA